METTESTAKPRTKRVSTQPRKKRAPAKKKAASPPPPRRPDWKRLGILGTEIGALVVAALVAVIAALGRAAEWFGGTGFWANLLPFAGAVLGLALVGAVLLWLWLLLRSRLRTRLVTLPAALAVVVALGAGWFAARDEFRHEMSNLRTLVGGTQEAERNTVAHQVFASYRRSDLNSLQRIIERAEVYVPTIEDAAKAYGVDAEVLVGVGAAESSFYPRDSKDGGKGLFQITAPPKLAVEEAKQSLRVASLDLLNQRHNTFVAAATFRHYLAEMHDDLFLGLLAYNIGPRNGGLLSIMKQYGARDFVTIQPYLQNLPRDYPIRVLTASLAYRLWRTEGKLPRYEEGSNALHIQGIGIPGLEMELKKVTSTADVRLADKAR
ncbi:MAG: transglycosylase [Proteobacteria bacterium]|nr:transglycosylase [Pseudomonadota bacterium]